jgi:hypothetical protein
MFPLLGYLVERVLLSNILLQDMFCIEVRSKLYHGEMV